MYLSTPHWENIMERILDILFVLAVIAGMVLVLVAATCTALVMVGVV